MAGARRHVAYEQHYAGKGGWSNWVFPRRESYKNACCGCGLVHVFQYRMMGRHIEFRVRVDKRATGQIRRYMPVSHRSSEDEPIATAPRSA